jgi:hypothetical protein
VERSVGNLSNVLADLGRVGSQRRADMLKSAGNYGVVMQQGIDKVLAQRSLIAKTAEIMRQAHNVYNNRLKETGGNAVDAQKSMNDFLGLWELDPALQVLDHLDEISQEEQKNHDERAKRMEEFHKQASELGQVWEEFTNDIKASSLAADGVIVEGLTQMVGLVKELHEWWGKAELTWKPPPMDEKIGPRSWGWKPERPGPGTGRGAGQSNPLGIGGGHEATGFGRGWDQMRPSELIEDVRNLRGRGEDVTKAIEANTAEQKKLNNYFQLLLGDGGGIPGLGGGGFGGGGGGGGGFGGGGFGGGGFGGGGGGATGSYTPPNGGSRPTASTPKSVSGQPPHPKTDSQAHEQPPAPQTSGEQPAPGAMLAPSGKPPSAFIVHHTGGRGTPESVVADWRKNRPGVGTQYIMDRNAVVHDVRKEYGYGGHGHFLHSQIPGVSNQTAVGMEIIAKNDADITETQKKNFYEWYEKQYPRTTPYGHSEASPGDRTNEGVEIAKHIREQRNQRPGPGSGKGAGQSNPLDIGGGHDQVAGAMNVPHGSHTSGKVLIGGKVFDWGSGGAGRGSMPFGSFNVDTSSQGIGSGGRTMTKHGFVDNAIAGVTSEPSGNLIRDPKYPKDPRTGVEIHPGKKDMADQLQTLGCFGIPPSQWSEFKKTFQEQAGKGDKLGIQIAPGKDEKSGTAYIGTTSPDSSFAKLDRGLVDAASQRNRDVDVSTSGTLSANVSAPKGTRVAVEGGGLFDTTETTRQMAMPKQQSAGGSPL